MNKKIILPIVMVLIILSLLILGIIVTRKISNKTEFSSNDTTVEVPKTKYTKDGSKIYSKEDLLKYITKVNINIENWDKYFKEYLDSDGKVIEQRTTKEFVCASDNVELHFHDNFYNTDFSFSTTGVGIFLCASYGTEGMQIQFKNLICTQATGTIYILNLPEEDWIINENNEKFIYIDFMDDTFTNYNVPNENCSKLFSVLPVQLLRFILN